MMSAIAINIKSILRHAHFIRPCVWSVNLRRGLSNANLHLRLVLMVHLSCHKLIDLCIRPPLSPISHEARVKSREKEKYEFLKEILFLRVTRFTFMNWNRECLSLSKFQYFIVRQRPREREYKNSRIVSYLSINRLILRYAVLVSGVSSAQF